MSILCSHDLFQIWSIHVLWCYNPDGECYDLSISTLLCLSNLDIKAMNDIELHYVICTGLIRRGGGHIKHFTLLYGLKKMFIYIRLPLVLIVVLCCRIMCPIITMIQWAILGTPLSQQLAVIYWPHRSSKTQFKTHNIF